MNEPAVSWDDAKQQVALEVLEGRPQRAARFVLVDLMRGHDGGRLRRRRPLTKATLRRLAVAPAQHAVEYEGGVVERARRIAAGLPHGQRVAIEAALDLVGGLSVADRIARWRERNPGRRATRAEIAEEIGAARETVVRAMKGVTL